MNLSEAMTWFAAQKYTADGASITYTRGATALSITAVRGRTSYETSSSDGTLIRMATPDYLVKASDITALTEPAAGDTITDGTAVYEVMSLSGENPWQWADWPNKTVYRIHCKQIT